MEEERQKAREQEGGMEKRVCVCWCVFVYVRPRGRNKWGDGAKRREMTEEAKEVSGSHWWVLNCVANWMNSSLKDYCVFSLYWENSHINILFSLRDKAISDDDWLWETLWWKNRAHCIHIAISHHIGICGSLLPTFGQNWRACTEKNK